SRATGLARRSPRDPRGPVHGHWPRLERDPELPFRGSRAARTRAALDRGFRTLRRMPDYTGIANLEALEEATNYNGFLVASIHEAACGAAACVDFGAGTGTLARALVARGIAVTCIEPDPTLRGRLGAAGLPVLATAEELAPDSTGYIYSVNVL